MMRATWILLALAGAAGGCDRTHLSPCFGQATRQALRTQVINPAAGQRRALEQGLDPEEAAIVARNYRQSLSSTKEEGPRPPLVILPTTAPVPGVPSSPPAAMTR